MILVQINREVKQGPRSLHYVRSKIKVCRKNCWTRAYMHIISRSSRLIYDILNIRTCSLALVGLQLVSNLVGKKCREQFSISQTTSKSKMNYNIFCMCSNVVINGTVDIK